MLKQLRCTALLGLLFCSGLAVKAETVLPGNTKLSSGQSVWSENGQYYLSMQTDGNLVLYRNDGVVRFATYKYGSGNYAWMQHDGNFVHYSANTQPLWHTHTYNNPGAFLAIQNDGNLVVYNTSGQALWGLGTDNTGGNPSRAGDVVARDLKNFGPLGHLGVWTGSKVVEAQGYSSSNTIRYVSQSEFKAASPYWGAASPRIPDYPVYACYQLRCPNLAILQNGYEVTGTRLAIVRRAYQAYITGADYTIYGFYTPAGPTWNTDPTLERGLYRCDTFVLDMYRITVYNSNASFGAGVDQGWKNKYDYLFAYPRTPVGIFELLKSYQ